jgi:hypothetical protein
LTAPQLAELGNLPTSYRHEWRVAEPREPMAVPGGVFKWYHVRREEAEVAAEMDAEARQVIGDAMAGGEGWNPEYGLNFALLHLSTAQAFLIAGVWRGHQELWERIYVKDLESGAPFKRMDTSGADAPAACVWELGVIGHERMAWHRYLFTGRSEADKLAWLADTYSGRV